MQVNNWIEHYVASKCQINCLKHVFFWNICNKTVCKIAGITKHKNVLTGQKFELLSNIIRICNMLHYIQMRIDDVLFNFKLFQLLNGLLRCIRNQHGIVTKVTAWFLKLTKCRKNEVFLKEMKEIPSNDNILFLPTFLSIDKRHLFSSFG